MKVLYLIASCLGLVLTGKVVDLPLLDFKIYSDHYSGYLNVSKTHRLHYWFFESQNTPSSDPLIFWFNGGPGCSSLFGMLEENGPFLFSEMHDSFRRNEYTWNRMANVVYLESPAGVGFSYCTRGNYTIDDDLTADENYEAIKEFLKEFPQFRNSDIFLTGESYAGIYIPMLADRIIDGQKRYPINLQGIAIGNGMLSVNIRRTSILFYSYYHGIIEERKYNYFVKKCCNGNMRTCDLDSSDYFCEGIWDFLLRNHPVLDRYDVSRKCSNSTIHGDPNIKPCRFDRSKIENYFKKEEVRKALHIPTRVDDWKMCDRKAYKSTRKDMSYYIKKSVKHGVRTLLFYGDQDSICDFMMGQQFVADLKLPKISTKTPWIFDNTVAGYKTTYEGLVFLTIRGAGHMVPMSHPRQSFYMIQRFLNNQPI